MRLGWTAARARVWRAIPNTAGQAKSRNMVYVGATQRYVRPGRAQRNRR